MPYSKPLDKTTVWVYDNCGNILKKREFALTLDRKKELEEIDFVDNTYVYDGDKLLSYNGNACRYNAHGNPTLYRGKSVSWRCIKQLVSYDGVTFSYDGFGRRITKNDIKYVYDSANRLIKQYRETTNGISEEMLFFYDMTGVAGFTYSGAVYLYRKDVQGNIIAILNSNGEILARYFYDAWGNHTVEDNSGVEITDTESIAHLNPFRYRGYYYDTETNLYYLKARYYDPDVGRFISMDDIAYLNPEAINGLNLYAYCGNNPVMSIDPSGHWVDTIFDLFSLGISIIEVVINPYDPLNWAGLVGDALDLIPFVTGVGETVKGVKVVAKGVDLADDAYDTVKFVKAVDTVDSFSDGGRLLNRVGNSTDYMKRTISNHLDGTKLHTMFMNNGVRINNTRLRVDGLDDALQTIFELKPYNRRNIRKGVKQIVNYKSLFGGGYKMVIVLY